MGQRDKREKAWKQSRAAAARGARTDGRQCGACTACCHAPEIPWLNKPLFTACTHLSTDAGCSIYAKRPAGCREFKCAWLAPIKQTRFLTEDDRPDRLGVMIVSSSESSANPGMDLWELRAGALDSARARRIRADLCAQKCSVTETRSKPESRTIARTLVTPTIDGKRVFIKDTAWGDRGNATYLFGP